MMDRQVIFVFGMHRTGSSALARVLALCGASLPESILGPEAGNPTGLWEPAQAVKLNDDFLFQHGATWFDPTLRLQSEIVFEEQEREAYVDRIRMFLEASTSKPLLVIKEPRITTLSDFWFEAASRAGLTVKAVISVRHPSEVSASLAVRDRASFELSNALWLKYNLLAERRSRGLPRVFVEYPNLLNDWRHEVARISEALSVDLSNSDGPRIDEFLRKELHRQRSKGEPAEAFSEPWVGQVYAAFSAAARNEPVDPRLMDEIFSAYRACERVFRISLHDFHTWTNAIPGFRRWFGPTSVPAEVQLELERLRAVEASAQEQGPLYAKAVADAESLGEEVARLTAAMKTMESALERLRSVEATAQEQEQALARAVADAESAREDAATLMTALRTIEGELEHLRNAETAAGDKTEAEARAIRAQLNTLDRLGRQQTLMVRRAQRELLDSREKARRAQRELLDSREEARRAQRELLDSREEALRYKVAYETSCSLIIPFRLRKSLPESLKRPLRLIKRAVNSLASDGA
jgi:hypothetical protein